MPTPERSSRVARARHPHTSPPRSEQDPLAWWTAFEAAWAEAGAPRVEAISVAGQQHGMVATDEHGTPVRPAKLWNDTETAPDVGWLIKKLGGPEAWAEAVGSVPGACAHHHQAVVAAPQRARRMGADAPCLPAARLAHVEAHGAARDRPRRRVRHGLLVADRGAVSLRPARDRRRRPRLEADAPDGPRAVRSRPASGPPATGGRRSRAAPATTWPPPWARGSARARSRCRSAPREPRTP